MIRIFLLLMLLICSITLIVIAEDETRGAESDSPRGAVDAQKKRKKSSKDWNKVDFNDLEKQWEEGDEDAEREMEFEHSEKIMKRKHREARERRLKEEEKKKKKKKKKKREGSATKKEAFKSKSKKSGEPKKKPTFKDDKGEWIPPPPGMEDLDLSQAIGPGGKAGGQMPPGLEGFNMNDMEAGGGLNTEKDMGPQMWFIEITMLQMQGSEKGKRWTRKALDKMAALWAEMLKTAHLSANMYVLGEYKNDPETKEETGPTLLVSLDKAWQQKEITRFIATKPEVLKLTKDRRTLTAANFADDDEDDDEL